MIEALDIALPRPRTLDIRTSPGFGEYAIRVYRMLEI
jgi:hypothetical protein